MCLRDERLEPANTPLEVAAGGMRVAYQAFGVAYVFLPGGTGRTEDLSGNTIGELTWSQ
jgi:hypothetical protein